ncbi:MAG: hypothetical protein IJO84_01425 [Butyricimonas sp.]|nr:hypothetical protein [Butyricimonas sp.]
MSIIEELEEIVAYQNSPEEIPLAAEIKKYIENYFQANVYKCRFRYDENHAVFTIAIFLSTNEELLITGYPVGATYNSHILGIGKAVCSLLDKYAFSYRSCMQRGEGLLFYSFENYALEACYASAGKEGQKFRQQFWNPDTMERIGPPMYVVYKTKEDMERAAENGELARIREAYYQFVKKYDTYDFITRDHHLLVAFDYADHALSPREKYEQYWDELREP